MKNRIIKFSVDRQRLAASEVSVVADSRNYLSAWFTFDKTWDGVEKTAVFSQGENVYNMLLIDDMCRIPAEVITGDGFYVSVFGGDLITADKIKIAVTPSGFLEGVSPPVPTPSIYDQMLNLVASEAAVAAGSADEAAQSAQSAKQSAGDAIEAAKKLDDAADAVKTCEAATEKANNAAEKANDAAESHIVIEQNKKSAMKVWIGTSEEYGALTEEETNCLYIITDDTLGDSLQAQINTLKTDYVIEHGKVGVWNYRKWASGIAECWAYEEYENVSFSNALDGGYSSGDILTELPITFINGASDTSIQGNANKFYVVGGTWIRDNVLYFDVFSLQNQTASKVDVRWYVIGKWK